MKNQYFLEIIIIFCLTFKQLENEDLITVSPYLDTTTTKIRQDKKLTPILHFKPKYITEHNCEDKFRKSSERSEVNNLKQLHLRMHVSKWLFQAYLHVISSSYINFKLEFS